MKKSVISGLFAVILIAGASLLGYIFKAAGFQDANIVVLYILAVLLTARFTDGYWIGLIASLAAAFAFNYFFTSPYYTFAVDNPNYIITLIFMTITSLITSAITSLAKRNEEQARLQEAQARSLYSLNNQVSQAHDMHEIAASAVSVISQILGCSTACLLIHEGDCWEEEYVQQLDGDHLVYRSLTARERQMLNRCKDQLAHTFVRGEEFYEWPIQGQDTLLGILRIPYIRAKHFNEKEASLIHSMSESIALAIDRIQSTQKRLETQEQVEQERYRSNLLRAISHDLRTPLTGIMGTAEMIMDMSDQKDERFDLAQGIYNSSQWLHTLVENILSLTRIQEGKLEMHKELEAVEEVVAGAVEALRQRTEACPIQVFIPSAVVMVPMDARLIRQVLINLLDNALKYAPQGSIELHAEVKKPNICFTVADHGDGIRDADRSRLFDMFYTKEYQHPDAVKGVGLGLTICKSIVEAHGGSIWAENKKEGKGAIFGFTLPMEVSDGI